MHNWIPLLYTWNLHNIVNQLYSNEKGKVITELKKEIGDINCHLIFSTEKLMNP